MGVELDRKRARDVRTGSWWRREGTAALTRRHGEGEKPSLSEQRSWRCETFGAVSEGGRSEWFWRLGEGGWQCHLVPSVPLNPTGISRRYGWESCSKSWERWRRGVSQMSSKLTQQDVFCDLERENRRGHNSWSSWYGNFFKLKAWTEALHLITSKLPGEKSVKTLFGFSSELKKCSCCCASKSSNEIWGLHSHGSFTFLSQLWVGKFSE